MPIKWFSAVPLNSKYRKAEFSYFHFSALSNDIPLACLHNNHWKWMSYQKSDSQKKKKSQIGRWPDHEVHLTLPCCIWLSIHFNLIFLYSMGVAILHCVHPPTQHYFISWVLRYQIWQIFCKKALFFGSREVLIVNLE